MRVERTDRARRCSVRTKGRARAVWASRSKELLRAIFAAHFRDGQGGGSRQRFRRREDASQARRSKRGHGCSTDVQMWSASDPGAPPANRDDYDGGTQTGSLRCLGAGALKHPCCCGHKGDHTGKGTGASPVGPMGNSNNARRRTSPNSNAMAAMMLRARCRGLIKKPRQGLELETSGWRRRESNPRPLPCDGSALPTELRPQDKCL